MTSYARFALLFDLDGTMLDTDQLHLAAYNTLLARYERTIGLDYYKSRIMGFPNDDIMDGLFPGLARAQQQGLSEEKEALFRGLLSELTPTAGLLDLLDWAKAHAVPVAVVTNAPRANAMLMLGGLGLAERFPHIVIGDELEHGKPHPLPYLTALKALGIEASDALAFEDSLAGVRAAFGAGIATFGMLTSLSEDRLRGAGACAVINDFQDPGLLAELARRQANMAQLSPAA